MGGLRSSGARALTVIAVLLTAFAGAGGAHLRSSIFIDGQGTLSGDVAAAICALAQDDDRILYGPACGPLWTDLAGRPRRDARTALAFLERASDDGLVTEDYHVADLQALARTLDADAASLPADVARFDVSMSREFLRYLRHLHGGRIDPRALGLRWPPPSDCHDVAVMLRDALSAGGLTEMVASLRPPFGEYAALRVSLARYRALAAEEPGGQVLDPAVTIRPGERSHLLRALSRRLAVLGDLRPGVPAPEGEVYEGALVEGVTRFQRRHGLDADGVIGKQTREALDVPLAWRARQLELALERLRWLPHADAPRTLIVNIPMFGLRAWDPGSSFDEPRLGMAVIVGRARRTPTPVFIEEMREVIFRPYWNIPPSILRHEILPLVAREPDYLVRQDMEIVRGQGDDARPVEVSPANLAQLRSGALRLRQRPGPKNSLGLIKFVFPNEENVYLHGTPAPGLFARSRRDFSHGCIRIADPVALAEWALEGRAEWSRESILAATTAGARSVHVSLDRPIRVILFYTTAAVDPESRMIRFADDIYLYDARLDRALRD